MSEPKPWTSRRQEIGQRLDAIRARIEELKDSHENDADTGADSERLAATKHHAAVSQAAAEQAIAYSVNAFRRAAEAHEQAAIQHERSAASGIGDLPGHQRQAALHRAAAADDRQRAEHAESLLTRQARDSQTATSSAAHPVNPVATRRC